MEYDKNGQILREFYARHDLTDCFERDNTYLESAFDEINRIWFDNLYKIDEVNYLMIAEAPLWGKSKSYIYNPATPFTQFFQKSDLEYVLGTKIRDKAEFIDRCNQIGLLIIQTESSWYHQTRIPSTDSGNPADILRLQNKGTRSEGIERHQSIFPLCTGKKHVSEYCG